MPMIATLIAVLLQSSGGVAATESASPPPVTGPRWLRRPNGEDIARNYPDVAAKEEIAGRATIICKVVAGGTLDQCEVASQSPDGKGFGEAAQRLGRLFKMQEADASGELVIGRTIRIPIVFRLPGGAEAKPVIVLAPAFAGARATVDCRVRAGAIDNCVVASATPFTPELSEAALSVAQQVKFQGSASGRALIPIIFRGETAKP
jgi:TonB family protein